jgi:hypothetical protein
MSARRVGTDQLGAHPRHPQARPPSDPHHPQASHKAAGGQVQQRAGEVPHHPQGGREPARPACDQPGPARRSSGDSASTHAPWCDCRETCAATRSASPPPLPGALRPLARALLSVAAEVHAARGEVSRIDCFEHESTLRMPKSGVRRPVRQPLRQGLRPPATPGRTGGHDASSHVVAGGGSPVENPDCLGECA